jgi:metallo-beta-lactamase family protein
MAIDLTFHGAARQVTGSCFLVRAACGCFLVDCGMFQGLGAVERNAKPFAFDPRTLDFVLLSHAHLDHSGLLPRLAAQGFTGPIYATAATADLLAIMLPDSAYLQQMATERAARTPRLLKQGLVRPPIYSLADVERCLLQVATVPYDEPFEPKKGIRCRLRDAGHILGSAIIELWIDGKKLVFSGDLGQPGRPIVRDPTMIESAGVLVVESTYGNRDHKSLDATLDELVAVVNRTLDSKRGNVIVPAFAVGRTQELLYYFTQLSRAGRFRNLRIFVDSPMATRVTAVTAKHFRVFDEAATRHFRKTSRTEGDPLLRFTASVEDSMALNRIHSGAIIVAGSGMCDGGRVRHHLRHNLPFERNTLLIMGFQAAGTLGRRLVDGATRVRLFGEDVPVRAEVATLGGFSAHADQTALLTWLRGFKSPPRATYVVHGEESAAEAFAAKVRSDLMWNVEVPPDGWRVTL